MSSLSQIYWKIGAIVGGVSAVTLSYFYYLGAFNRITFRRNVNVGPYLLIYRNHIGPFSTLGAVAEQIREIVEQQLKIPYESGFGMYFDNPREVSQYRLRSYIGQVIDSKYYNDESFKQKVESVGLKLLYIPQTVAMITTFPFRSTVSYAVGAKKVYAAASKLGMACKSGVLEIYSHNTDPKTITYIFPETNLDMFTFVNYTA